MEIGGAPDERRAKANRDQRTSDFRETGRIGRPISRRQGSDSKHTAPELRRDIVDKGIMRPGRPLLSDLDLVL